MRWQLQDPYEWHRWFAWRPVMIKGWRVVWLETVERKRPRPIVWGWNYRMLGEE